MKSALENQQSRYLITEEVVILCDSFLFCVQVERLRKKNSGRYG